MNGDALALGRNWYSADSLSTTDFGDCSRVDLRWQDGAHVYVILEGEDHRAQSLAYAADHGFVPN